MIAQLHIYSEGFVFSAESIWAIVKEAALDTLKTLPFLLAAFLIIEFLEHHAQDRLSRVFRKDGKAGPLAGAVLGCIPQCGFSVMCANLYTGGIITTGTLIAVFLSTSDEAVILLGARPGAAAEILKLLVTKVIIAIIAGYAVDFIAKRFFKGNGDDLSDLCEHDHCGCDEHEGIVIPALVHTAKVFGFLLLFSVILNFAVEFIGSERLSALLLSDSVFQPVFAALLGFIPNCAASVLLTQLYLEGALSFGSVIAGLGTSAGAGMLILFREKSRIKGNLKLIGILYICAVIPGMILQILGV